MSGTIYDIIHNSTYEQVGVDKQIPKYPVPNVVYHQITHSGNDDPGLFNNIQCSLSGRCGTKTARHWLYPRYNGIDYAFIFQKSCRGVYQCTNQEESCNVTAHLNSNKERRICKEHNVELIKVECNAKFYFFQDKKKANHMIVLNKEHKHFASPSFKVLAETRNHVKEIMYENPNTTTNQLVNNSKLNSISDLAVRNRDSLSILKRKSLEDIYGSGDTLNKIFNTLGNLEKEEWKKEEFLFGMSRGMWNTPYKRFVFTDDNGFIIQMQTPLQSMLFVNNPFIVCDVQHHNEKNENYHHFGISLFSEELEKGFFICRFRHSNLKTDDYKKMWMQFFTIAARDTDNTIHHLLSQLLAVVVDFSTAQLIGFQNFLMELNYTQRKARDIVLEMVNGCWVHFQRSLFRMANCVAEDETERQYIKKVEKVLNESESVDDIKGNSCELIEKFPRMKKWWDWWFKMDGVTLQMVLNSLNKNNNDIIPSDTNLVESLNGKNKRDTPDRNILLYVYNQIKTDVNLFDDVMAVSTGVNLSYCKNTIEKRKERSKCKKKINKNDKAPETHKTLGTNKRNKEKAACNENTSNETHSDCNKDGVFIADELLQKKTVKGKDYFLVKWKGYNHRSNTWEPRCNIIGEGLLQQFEATKRKKKKSHIKLYFY